MRNHRFKPCRCSVLRIQMDRVMITHDISEICNLLGTNNSLSGSMKYDRFKTHPTNYYQPFINYPIIPFINIIVREWEMPAVKAILPVSRDINHRNFTPKFTVFFRLNEPPNKNKKSKKLKNFSLSHPKTAKVSSQLSAITKWIHPNWNN